MEELLKGRQLGDWDGAEESALKVLAHTDAYGRNRLFSALLTYKDAAEHETVLNALAIVETCAGIAPWIIDRSDIFDLAGHPEFSVRASAASICMEIARVAPDRVPVDILLNLSRYNEDWYVQAPANAALKTIAHVVPGVLRIFLDRLRSVDGSEREHAASQLFSISREEPEILDKEKLEDALRDLAKRRDNAAFKIMTRTMNNVRKTDQSSSTDTVCNGFIRRLAETSCRRNP